VGALFKRLWYLDGEHFLTTENGNEYAYLEVDQRASLTPGQYRVELYVGDDLQQVGSFTIQAQAAPATVTPILPSTPIPPPAVTAALPPAVAEGVACQRPPDDYRRTEVNGEAVNARTLWMLELAGALYEGRGSPLRVVQGSYTDELAESFGTHAGGGVVDISIREQAPPNDVMTIDEAEELVYALRLAGFAAWLRLPEDLDPPASLHIHAVAVGDQELSAAARRQLDGPEGYFRGFDGVPPEHGGTHVDRYGGPIVCDWMIDLGFSDLR
jgi:hypothetical protein